MKKLVTLALAGVCALAFAAVADAGTVVQQKSDSTRATKSISRDSKVYANTATGSKVSAGWQVDYIYSSDITNSSTVFDNLRAALNDPYSSLVPSVVDETTTTGLFNIKIQAGEYENSWKDSISKDMTTVWGTNANGTGGQKVSGTVDWTSVEDVAHKVIPGRDARIDKEEKTDGVNTDDVAAAAEEEEENDYLEDSIVTADNQIFSNIGSHYQYVYTMKDGQLRKELTLVVDVERTTIYSASQNKYVSPLVLDITGNGVLQASNGQNMPGHPVVDTNVILADFYGDGFEIGMEWVGPQDGLLVAPKADGSVDMSCLFGTAGGYENGYEKLSLYDKNSDNKVNGEELVGLSVWQDANSNGVADAGEVKTVQELGITEIAITPNNNFVSSFTMNGKTNKMWDWWPNAIELIKLSAK